jgi:cytoskeletal protein CcmA (bactofilin family)
MPFWNKPREDVTPEPTGSAEPGGPAVAPPQREERKPMAMLKRDEVSSTPGASGDLNALLGRGSEFEGKLTFEGTVRIDGKFNGTIITSDVLVVGEGARVSAEITCGTIIVHGEVQGNVRAKNAVELHHPAKMRGNIESPSLMVEKGVMFEGQSKMENLDKGAPAKSASAASPSPTPIAAVKP